jgi:hypothetical protein
MNVIFTTSIQKTVIRVMRTMFVDAILGAVFAGLYGFVFGGFGALVHDESHRLIWNAGIFALCGAAAGLLLGACSAISEVDGKSADASSPESDVLVKGEKPFTAVRQFVAPTCRRPQNSPSAV